MDKPTQQERILNALKIRPNGLNSYVATYEMKIKQAPTRINELRNKKYNIVSVPNSDGSVNWILNGTIKEEVKPTYKWEFEDGIAKQVLVNQEPIQQNLL